MRISCAMILVLGSSLLRASEPETPPGAARPDPLYSNVDAAFRATFKGASLLKVERKERIRATVSDILMLFPGRNEVVYKLTITDALNKRFDIVFDANAELIATDKYKAVVESLTPALQDAIAQQAPNARASTEPLDAKLEKGVYKVSGKIDGKKVNVEVPIAARPPATEALSAPVVRQPLVVAPEIRQPASKDSLAAGSPIERAGKPEISASVDGPFRILFKDATILNVKREELTSVSVNVFSVGGGSIKYEVTLSDPLNKKFKVVFTEGGHLCSTTNYITPFDRLPRGVQSAIEKMTPVPDRGAPVDVRIDHKKYFSVEHEEYKVSGKINGAKIDVTVPVYSSR